MALRTSRAHPSPRTRRRLVAALATGALLLAGCADDDDEGEGGQDEPLEQIAEQGPDIEDGDGSVGVGPQGGPPHEEEAD